MSEVARGPLIRVENVSKTYPGKRTGLLGRRGIIHAVRDVSFVIGRGETLGLVGESGSGKSTVARQILRLETPDAGLIEFRGQDLSALSEDALRPHRRHMQVVFQDPYASLNPKLRVGVSVAEPCVVYDLCKNKAELRERIDSLLTRVGLDPEFAGRFPHEFSGGQRQRICIARALAVDPDFIILDEAIAALDVSIQAQIVNLLRSLQSELGMAYLFITHDLSMVRYICHRVAVMYQGRIVELAETSSLFDDPLHPYTRLLLSAIPIPDPEKERRRVRQLRDPNIQYEETSSTLVEVKDGHFVAERFAT